MKRWIWIGPLLLLVALALSSCGQSTERLNNEGNEAFLELDFGGALTAYAQAQEGAPELAEPYYNAANAHYRQEAYDLAQQQIDQALINGESLDTLDQFSYFNLGNNFYQTEQYQGAVEAYIEALRLDSDDLEAKQNLELALRKLQQEENEQDQQCDQPQDEEQQDSEQDKQSGDQPQGEEQQDSEQDKQSGDQPQDEEQQDGDDPQDGEQQDGEQDPQSGDRPQDGEEPQEEGQPGDQPGQFVGLTEEQARQLLEAAAQGTESLEQFLQQILMSPNAPPSEDW